jgi:hypothetical protein
MFDHWPGRRAWKHFGGVALALLVGGSAPVLVDCSSSDDAGATGPGLRFTYDEDAKRVRVQLTQVTVDETLSVYVQLRKGTLTLKSLDEIDCTDVVASGERVSLDSVSLDGGGADAADAATSPMFAGPQVAAKFLDQFYELETIGPDATDAQLEAIYEGTDPIVEGCLLKDGKPLAKAQVSIFRAWDDATPDLLDRVQKVENGGPKDPKAVMHSVGTYGALCERELGEIPFFPDSNGTSATFDCTNGVIVPITVTQSGAAVEQTTEPAKCDRPDWLRRSCAPFARVQHTVNSKGTDWVLICRKMAPGQKKEDTTFSDQGLIGHNPTTGKSCYFQNGLYGKRDGAHVASPADVRVAEATWSSFDVSTCHSCHDNDAFAHSPWIDQALTPEKEFVVPRIGSHKSYPMNNAAPFSLVGARTKGWTMREQLVSPEARACTTCHRIAAGNTITGEQTGAGESWTERAVGIDDAFQTTRVSPGFQAFANSHWMPPTLGALDDASWASSDYGKAVEFIRGCQTSKTCVYAPIPSK